MSPLQRLQKYSRFSVFAFGRLARDSRSSVRGDRQLLANGIFRKTCGGLEGGMEPRWSAGTIGEIQRFDRRENKTPNSRRVTLQRGVLDANGALRDDAPILTSNGMAVIPKSPADGPKRYLIASYTIPRDSRGLVGMNDGNFQNSNIPTGVELKIFLSGTLLKDLTVGKDRVPTLFQQALGPLKKGDAISVAVGPAKTGTRSGGLLRYTLEEWQDGQSPPPPLNTVRLPIDVERPQFGPDGTCAVYEAKQASFNETLLARKPELVFVGDSNSQRWGIEMFEENFSAYRPVNLGVGGDCVQNVACRHARVSPMDESHEADLGEPPPESPAGDNRWLEGSRLIF